MSDDRESVLEQNASAVRENTIRHVVDGGKVVTFRNTEFNESWHVAQADDGRYVKYHETNGQVHPIKTEVLGRYGDLASGDGPVEYVGTQPLSTAPTALQEAVKSGETDLHTGRRP